MARRLRIEFASGQKVTARLEVPAEARSTVILLAHGAGAGQDHPWMVSMRELLAGRGYPTMTFNYPYTEAGRRAPDRMERLLEAHAAAADRAADYGDRVVLAGKSMGGRASGHLAGDLGWAAAGLVYLGYPLVATWAKRTEPRDTEHLLAIEVPQLFVSGTNDPMGPAALIEALAGRVRRGEYLPIDAGNHSLQVPKRTGLTNDEVLESVAAHIEGWLDSHGL